MSETVQSEENLHLVTFEEDDFLPREAHAIRKAFSECLAANPDMETKAILATFSQQLEEAAKTFKTPSPEWWKRLRMIGRNNNQKSLLPGLTIKLHQTEESKTLEEELRILKQARFDVTGKRERMKIILEISNATYQLQHPGIRGPRETYAVLEQPSVLPYWRREDERHAYSFTNLISIRATDGSRVFNQKFINPLALDIPTAPGVRLETKEELPKEKRKLTADTLGADFETARRIEKEGEKIYFESKHVSWHEKGDRIILTKWEDGKPTDKTVTILKKNIVGVQDIVCEGLRGPLAQ
jgi:hypothetical protein